MSYSYLSSHPGLGLSYNYSLLAVPAGWLVGMAPLWWAIGATEKSAPGSYNNAIPQESWKKLGEKNTALSPKLKGRILRAVAANNNTHVNLPLFASAVVAANAAHVDAFTLHVASATWVASRIAYTLAYIYIEDGVLAWARSGIYLTGIASCFTLFIKAANKYSSLPW